MRLRITAGLLVAALAAGMLTLRAPPVLAGSKGRRNFALGLGALAAYELLQGKTGTGLLAAGGAAYAYKRYSDARKQERRDRYFSNGYSGSRYPNGGNAFQFPSGYPYSGTSGYQYQNGYAVTNDGTRYARRHRGPYTTDTWGNRRYYNPRYGDGEHVYGAQPRGYYSTAADRQGNDPQGWRRGHKRGWRGHSVPPGQWRR